MASARVVRYWWVVAGVLMGAIWGWGAREMYFHQDDLDWLILANQSWREVLTYPIGDHVNYVWRIILKGEWELFGASYQEYLMVSLLIHGVVVALFYRLASRIGSKAWAGLLAMLLVVNTNWTETVLWMSGQTILITALCVLLAMNARWERKWRMLTLWLASWTSALALGLVLATGIVDGWEAKRRVISRMGWGVLGVLGGLGAIYTWLATDGTIIAWSWGWVGRVVAVIGLAELTR